VALILIILSALASLVNACFYLGPAARLVQRLNTPPIKGSQKHSVDILIAARNEAVNLKKFLPKVLKQEGENISVLVVNDNSEDDTGEILRRFEKEYNQLKVISAFAKTRPGKKAALTQAIELSNADWILATDADCKPTTHNWAKRMRNAIGSKTEIVLGYSPYRKLPGWLNRWIRFEALYTAAQYMSATLTGRPYMGVGRNILYSRALFDRVGGFESHAHLAGGDDDLLVNQGATATNTQICIDADAWVYSEPHTSWSEYVRQKTRHLSVGTTYKRSDQLWLGLLAATHVAHFIGVVTLLSMGIWQVALLVYSVRLAIVWPRMAKIAKGLAENDLIPFLPLLDFGICMYYMIFSIQALFATLTT